MPKAVGIDLGTTNSVIAVMEGGEVNVISNTEGSRLTPSVVAFTKEGQRLVGIPAKRQALLNPENTIFSIKRLIGRRYYDTEIERKMLPYQIVEDRNGLPRVVAQGKEHTPEEISSMILQKLKSDAEAYLGEEIKQAVVTVPAYFDNSQRTATKNAGEIAGLEVLRIINEPTAAALAYGLDKKKEGTVLVFDLGGGTFDVSILEIGEGVFEVKSTSGDTHLGGDDWDQRLVDYCVSEFRKQTGVDLREDKEALQRLREACEKAKVELSTLVETEINLPYIAPGPKHLNIRITRAKFEELTRDLLARCRGPFERALADANLSAKELGEVILVGGATRMPMVQELVRELTGKEPHKGVNPDEVVAVGAAIQAAILTGKTEDIVLLDVTPLSLGVETLGNVMTVLIARNTTIPTRKSEVFTTAADGQSSVEIHVLQGERPMASDNKTLGTFHLMGIPPAPRGIPQIEVTFDIDANGILNVSAKDRATGQEQSITITGSSNLTREEIDHMVKDAERYAEQDRKRRELAETRNEADNLIYTVQKTLQEHGEKVSSADRASIEGAINDLKTAMGSDETASIRRAIDRLKQEMFKISEVMYRAATAQAQSAGTGDAGEPTGGGAQQGSAPGTGEVIDADFKPSN